MRALMNFEFVSGKFRRFFRRDIITKYVRKLISWRKILKLDGGRLRVCDESYMKYTDEYLFRCM